MVEQGQEGGMADEQDRWQVRRAGRQGKLADASLHGGSPQGGFVNQRVCVFHTEARRCEETPKWGPIEKRKGPIVVQVGSNPACNRMRAASSEPPLQP